MHFIGIVLVVVAVSAAGYYFGAAVEKNNAATSRDALVKEIFSPILSVSNVAGKILEISPDQKSFMVEVLNMFQVNLPIEYRIKRITLVPETKLVLFEQKATDVFNKEMEAFIKKQASAKGTSSAGSPPMPVVEKETNPNDLKVGDMVSVLFAPDQGKTFFDSELIAVHVSINR